MEEEIKEKIDKIEQNLEEMKIYNEKLKEFKKIYEIVGGN